MPIKVTCDCGKVTNVPDAYAGRTGKCPGCGKPVRVPGVIAAAGPAVAARASQPAAAPTTVPAPVAPALTPAAIAPAPVHVASVPVSSAPAEVAEESASAEVEGATTDEAAEPEEASSEEISETAESEGAPAEGEAAPQEADNESVTTKSPPSESIHTPTEVPHELEQPNCPTLYVVISTDGASVFTQFDASPVLDTFIESFAKRLKGKFDVRLGAPRLDEATPGVLVHLVRIHQGERKWRYLVPVVSNFLGAATCVAVDGNIQLPGRKPVPFKFKHGCRLGVLGGPLGLLKADARVLAKKLAKKVRKTR